MARGLARGQRVEIAPYRGGRFFYSYAHLDGCRAVVRAVYGTKADLDVESGAPDRAGYKGGVPVEALKPLGPA